MINPLIASLIGGAPAEQTPGMMEWLARQNADHLRRRAAANFEEPGTLGDDMIPVARGIDQGIERVGSGIRNAMPSGNPFDWADRATRWAMEGDPQAGVVTQRRHVTPPLQEPTGGGIPASPAQTPEDRLAGAIAGIRGQMQRGWFDDGIPMSDQDSLQLGKRSPSVSGSLRERAPVDVAPIVAKLRNSQNTQAYSPDRGHYDALVAMDKARPQVDEFADTEEDVARKQALASAPWRPGTGVPVSPEQRASQQQLTANKLQGQKKANAELAQKRGVLRPEAEQALVSQGLIKRRVSGMGGGDDAFLQLANSGQLNGLDPSQRVALYLALRQEAQRGQAMNSEQSFAREKMLFSDAADQRRFDAQQAAEDRRSQAALALGKDQARSRDEDQRTTRMAMAEKAFKNGEFATRDEAYQMFGVNGANPTGGDVAARPAPSSLDTALQRLRQLPSGAATPDAMASLLDGVGDLDPQQIESLRSQLSAMGMTPDRFDAMRTGSKDTSLGLLTMPRQLTDDSAGWMHNLYNATTPLNPMYWLLRESEDDFRKRQQRQRVGRKFGSTVQ